MDIILMPENLRKVLGDEASKELIDLVVTTRKSAKESILETAADKFERRLAEFKGEVKEEISEVCKTRFLRATLAVLMVPSAHEFKSHWRAMWEPLRILAKLDICSG